MTDKAIPQLSTEAEARLAELVKRYDKTKSAIMPALYIAQEECGYLTDTALRWVSDRLKLPLAHVMAVATFYTMYYKKPVGRYHIQVCRTLSCMLCGAQALTNHLRKRLQLKPGEVSRDGMWSYEEVECLGSCGTAPMVEINDTYFENLSIEKLDRLLDRIQREQPDLRYSTVRGTLGRGFADLPKSEVWKG